MNLLVIISAQLILLLSIPAPYRRRNVSILVFGADHEADLTGRIGGDGGVRVFDSREDLLAGFFEVGNESEMEPLVFRCESC